MLKLTLLLTGVATTIVAAPAGVERDPARPLPDGRIVGGSNANIVNYPYQASLQYTNIHICGASIISNIWLLTAAHCVMGGTVSLYTIRVDTSTFNSGGTVYGVSNIIHHDSYRNLDYDIAAIQTSAIISALNARAISMAPAGSKPSPGVTTTITGWGLTSESGGIATMLQVVQVPVISQASCREAYGFDAVTDRMICAGLLGIGGKDACQGDSGGPLVANGVLTGLVSWGKGCARPDFPGVYSSIPNLRHWITATTGL